MQSGKNHYSYRVYADPGTARSFDLERFGGPIGEWIRSTQERAVFSILPDDITGWNVIDVGAGTGRFTIPLLKAGAGVTACDASEEMLKVLTEKTENPRLRIQVIDAHHLEFTDQSFDCALAFRILMHVVDWHKVLSEVLRVSRDWVIFDIPPRRGFLILAPVWHRLQQIFQENVQTYRTLSLKEIHSFLRLNGFEITRLDHGFFLPLVVHRVFGSPRWSRISERFFSAIGLTRVFGSPLTVFARRKR